jgi:hypothetical protein
MPPRRRQSERLHLGLSGQEVVILEEKLVASRHLSQQFFAMAKELKRELTCPVCLFTPCSECLERTMVIRQCGHVQCAVCVLSQMNEGEGDATCPLCRQ